MLGHGRFSGDPLDDAISRFKTVAYGGTAIDDEEAGRLLRTAGLGDVRTVPTPRSPGDHGGPPTGLIGSVCFASRPRGSAGVRGAAP